MFLPSPLKEILITEQCNLNCDYCFKSNFDANASWEYIKEFIDSGSFSELKFFGGEPFLKADLIFKTLDYISNNPRFTAEEKAQILKPLKYVTTNGTLVDQYIEKIKAYGLVLQFSLDGPENVHDVHRKTKKGNGSFNKIIGNIALCYQYNIDFTIHSVISRNNFSQFAETIKFFYNISLKYCENNKSAIISQKGNRFKFIFEEEFTDDDIDILIDQIFKIALWIHEDLKELSSEEKSLLFDALLRKRPSVCGAGSGLKTIDTEKTTSPCHRMSISSYQNIGDSYRTRFDNNEFISLDNCKSYNSLHSLMQSNCKMYGYFGILDEDSIKMNTEFNFKLGTWCPAANIQLTSNPFYIPSKYSVLIQEINRAIDAAQEKLFPDTDYFLDKFFEEQSV